MVRGRICFALYELMGIGDCIAQTHEQYIDLASQIATDPDRRSEISRKIIAADPSQHL